MPSHAAEVAPLSRTRPGRAWIVALMLASLEEDGVALPAPDGDGVLGALLAVSQQARGHDAHLEANDRPPVTLRGGLAGWQVRRVTRFMEENLDRDIKLRTLAQLVNLSRCHFCTAFRQTMGFTPGEWLQALRLRQACILLARKDSSITQVALAVGYQTPAAFAASFRKVFAVTPTAFRENLADLMSAEIGQSAA